jgi:hypothetical protein
MDFSSLNEKIGSEGAYQTCLLIELPDGPLSLGEQC